MTGGTDLTDLTGLIGETGIAEDELKALSSLRFNWALTPDDVWSPFPDHEPRLHVKVARRVLGGVATAKLSSGGSPLGLVVQGEKGSGKSHLLGWVREQVQHDDGYFFLIGLSSGLTFWANVVESILDGLWREVRDDGTQLRRLLRRLAARAGTSRVIENALNGSALSRRGLDSFVKGLSQAEGHGGPELQDTARALVLYAVSDPELRDVAKDYFLSTPDLDSTTRSPWGIRSGRPPQLIVQDLSRLLALTGQTVIAIDQIDSLIARSSASVESVDSSRADAGRDEVVAQVAEGVMALREVTRRTLLILACLPNSWTLIRNGPVDSARDRFRATLQLTTIPAPEVGRTLIEKRFTSCFREVGFVPPYPTWPIAPEAFESAADFTPRGLLRRIEAHIEACLDNGEVTQLRSLDEVPDAGGSADGSGGPAIPAADLDRLDAQFHELTFQADVGAVFDPTKEDRVLPGLLAAGLKAWIEERQGERHGYTLDPPPGSKPGLHARLKRTVNEDVEAELHWAFRGISSSSAISAQSRVRTAVTVAGIQRGDPTRSLILVRNTVWPKGIRTHEILTNFREAGGIETKITDDDLCVFAALEQMLAERDPALRSWLAIRRPASKTDLLRTSLPAVDPAPGGSQADPGARAVRVERVPSDTAAPVATAAPGGGMADGSPPTRPIPIIVPAAESAKTPAFEPDIELGRIVGTDQPVGVTLEALRMHTVIFAGSGSGKTVLLRRLVEECALQGVSSIVLDPNNDLARLGDGWPSAPPNWRPDDPARAERYLAETDVVIWTPRRENGRPLTFQPLPDFTSVLDDADEFQMAVDVAFGALAPRARADGRTRKAQEEQAVLRESIRFFARGGGGDLADLIDLMGNLPPEATSIGAGVRMAAAMAETLRAAMVNDPLFGGSGESFDPAVLLTPPPGKRARVSVISMIGLPSDGQRQGFVSQLQMALFSWFKKNPSDRPLGGLLVMDEAQTIAPSGSMTVSTESTLALASQARKYGLGLVFATQAPKGLHNRVSGNAATQIYGFLNSPSQIDTAREIARAKGGDVADISRLAKGEFYLAGEGLAFSKIRTSFCLSYHPSSPLSPDDVLARARRSAPTG